MGLPDCPLLQPHFVECRVNLSHSTGGDGIKAAVRIGSLTWINSGYPDSWPNVFCSHEADQPATSPRRQQLTQSGHCTRDSRKSPKRIPTRCTTCGAASNRRTSAWFTGRLRHVWGSLHRSWVKMRRRWAGWLVGSSLCRGQHRSATGIQRRAPRRIEDCSTFFRQVVEGKRRPAWCARLRRVQFRLPELLEPIVELGTTPIIA